MTCEERLQLGAYVLGGLPDEEHRAYAAHLRTCPECQVEAAQLSGLPRLLDLVDDPFEPYEPVGAAASRPGADAAAGLLALLRQHRRRTRLRLAVAACVAGLALLGLGWFAGARVATPARPAATQLSAVPASGLSAQVDVDLVPRGWGTQLEVTAAGLPTQGSFVLWVVDDSGRSLQAATWRATSAGRASLTAATATSTGAIRVVEVRADSGQPIATAST